MGKTLKEHSKSNYTVESPNIEELRIGCLQRIADATELMATNFLQLQSDNEYLRKRNQNLIYQTEFLTKQSASYKGKFNRLKKIIDNGKK